MKNNWQESEKIEFKETLAEKEDAGKDICAFANKNGGELFFGVKNDGKILGIKTANEKTLRDLVQYYRDNIQPSIYPTVEIDDQALIRIVIIKSDTPYHIFKNVPYIRVGSSSNQMRQEEYKRKLNSYQSTNSDYSSKTIKGTTIVDLSERAIENLRKLLTKSKRFGTDIKRINNLELLQNLQLIQKNEITVAALILLGTNDSVSKYLPYTEIRYGYRLSKDEIRNQDTMIFNGGYFLYYDELWQKINSRNITLNIPQGLFLSERKAFEEDSIREAINNAVTHRDYQTPESTFVMQFPTLIEIKSPGGFVEGITIENILDQSKTRNKLVAEILYKCELVEQFGTGIDLLYKNQLSLGKNPPNYNNSDENRVVLELDGSIQDIEFAKYVLKVADERQKSLGNKELLLLYKIKSNQKVPLKEVKNLLDIGLIEKIGYGKWSLSKRYYVDTHHRGTYTRSIGLDKETNKELLIKHLKEFPDGARKQELLEVLPHLEWYKIWRILNVLIKEHIIVFTGPRRSKSGVYKLL